MDLPKYLSSGILELYVLDLLTEDESKEVEKNMIDYPEIRAEVDAIEDALLIYGTCNARVPPIQLNIEILDEIE